MPPKIRWAITAGGNAQITENNGGQGAEAQGDGDGHADEDTYREDQEQNDTGIHYLSASFFANISSMKPSTLVMGSISILNILHTSIISCVTKVSPKEMGRER